MPKILTISEESSHTKRSLENQSVTSSTVLVDSDYLHYPVSTGLYKISFGIVLTSSTTGLHKLTLSAPANSEIGVIVNYSGALNSTSFTQTSARGTGISALALITDGAGGEDVRILGDGYVNVIEEGDLQFQFAQSTPHTTATTLRQGSLATFERMR